MPFDVLLHINENSQRGRVIQQMAAAQHVTPEQVIEKIIDDSIEAQHNSSAPTSSSDKSPADILLGLFSSPEDTALMDEVTDIVYASRKAGTTRDIGLS